MSLWTFYLHWSSMNMTLKYSLELRKKKYTQEDIGLTAVLTWRVTNIEENGMVQMRIQKTDSIIRIPMDHLKLLNNWETLFTWTEL